LSARANVPLALAAAAPLGAIAAALALAAGLILAAGVNPLAAYGEMLRGALGSRLAVTEMLTRAVPLMLTGLAAAVAFRARLWNIGGEGQFYLGALAVAWVGHSMIVGLPPALGIAVLMAVGMAAGALLLAGPAFLRLRFGVDEVVTTLLLNFVVILFVGLMIEGPLRDPLAFGWPQSVPVDSDFRLPDLVPRTRLHVGLLIALAVAAWSGWSSHAPSSGRRRGRRASTRARRLSRGSRCRGRSWASRSCRAGLQGSRAPSRSWASRAP
jgi:general nucleoside transport system permease protein